ncbi:hypothetical protein RRG08_016565 [Elysia crispata]|uniref:Uncharacterized protein n=1 Tax=Elysia crispata TaxID=231223 RepID=A0AAE1ASB1_9GAST|nr:hypothetical protein RRG08_016565 [Elysia crispata]
MKSLCIITLMTLILRTETYILRGRRDYTIGDTMEVTFVYDKDHTTIDHSLELDRGMENLLTCSILGIRFDYREGAMFVQTIHIPTDFFDCIPQQNSYLCTDSFTLTISEFVWNDTFTLQLKMKLSDKVEYFLIGKSIYIYGNGIIQGRATHVINDENIPSVSREKYIEIKFSDIESKYRYKMELYRIDYFAADLCPSNSQGGKIDLEKFISLQAMSKCIFDMKTGTLGIQGNVMPFGFIKVIMIIENDYEHHIMQRFFKVTGEGIDFQKTRFHAITSPYADEFSWPPGRDLVIQTYKSYFPYTHQSFGQDKIYPPYISQSLNCKGDSALCQHLEETGGPNRYINGSVSRRQASHAPVTLQLVFIWRFSYFDSTQVYKNEIPKTIVFKTGSFQVDIMCLRNCLVRYNPRVPGIMAAKCLDCHDAAPEELIYNWEVLGTVAHAEGFHSRYLSIYNFVDNLDFKIKVKVVNNVFVGEGFAQKSFSIGLQDRFTWLKKSLKASDNASLFDTFDFATTIDPPIIIEDEAPVAIFFRFDSEEAHERLEVCTYSSPYKYLALRIERGIPEARAGVQTAGGNTYIRFVRLPVSLYA